MRKSRISRKIVVNFEIRKFEFCNFQIISFPPLLCSSFNFFTIVYYLFYNILFHTILKLVLKMDFGEEDPFQMYLNRAEVFIIFNFFKTN